MIFTKHIKQASNELYDGLFPEEYVNDILGSFRFLCKHVESVYNLSEHETQAYVMQQGERRFVIAGFDKTGELSFFFEESGINNQDFYDRVKDLPGDKWKFVYSCGMDCMVAEQITSNIPKAMSFTIMSYPTLRKRKS